MILCFCSKRKKPINPDSLKDWSSDKIKEAGEYVANLSKNKALQDGIIEFGEYDGVRVGVIRTNGKIATVFPDSEKQP